MAKPNAPANSSSEPSDYKIINSDVTFRKLIENSFSGISLLDKNLQTIYRTPSAERISGWSPAERLKNATEDLIHPADRDRVNQLLQDVLITPNSPKTCIFRSRHFAGHYIWLECTFTNMFHEPDVNAIVCNFKDITSQKQAEEQLQKTIQELSAFKHALDESAIVAITDQKGIIRHVNDNFCEISKFSRQDLLGQDHRLINSGHHDKSFIRDLWTTIAKGKIWKGELKNKAKDSSYYWVDTTIVPFLNDEDKPYQYVAIRSDITQRKQEEEHLRLLESVIVNSTDAVLITEAYPLDEPGPCIIYINEAFTKMTGYTHDDILGKTPRILQGEKSDKLELKRLGQAMRKVEPCEITIVNYKKNGDEFWVNFSVSPVRDQDGNCTHFISIEKDVTQYKTEQLQRQLLSEAVTASLEERNTILESIGDAFFAIDNNWIITYWNKTAERVLFKNKEDVLGNNLWEIFSDAVNSRSYQEYHHAVETNRSAHFEDFYTPLGKWYEVSAYPSKNGLSVYFKDITERKLSDIQLKDLNQSLQIQAKELATSNAELEQFAYVASHDLQEPLRMVTSFLTQIEKKYGTIIDDKGKQYIHFAVDGAKRMRQIILDLLDFSRIGRADDAYEQVDIGKIIADILALYRKKIEDKKASITITNMPVIQTLKVPIRQVFQNLISNSLKYQKTGESASVTISCESNNAFWEFAVKDNGIGIDPDYFEKIFIIFQRLHNKDEFSGTGMGLAVTKKIIENLGGRIWVESVEGEGSTFYFTILKVKNHEIDTHLTN